MDLAKTLINLYVRYSVVAQRESTLLETTVFNVARELRKTCDFATADQTLRERAPDLEEFAKQFAVCSISRAQTATYLLRKLEEHGRSTGEFQVAGTDRVHLEHIYPKQPAGNWDRFTNHSAWINRLGNLALLDRGKNTSIKNQPFEEKKKAYSKSEVGLTKRLEGYDVWDEAQIELRQKAMALEAVQIWKFPDEKVPADIADSIAIKLSDLEHVEELPEFPESPEP